MPEDTLQDVEQQDPTLEGSDSADGGEQEEPFLPVDERTVYKTREDAIKGYREAGQRIAQLSGWEKQAKGYGISDPSQLRDLVEQHLELRRQLKELEKGGGKSAAQDTGELSKEEKAARAWLQKAAGDLGYVSKDTIAELQAKIEELTTHTSSAEAQRLRNQAADGRERFAEWLKSDGIEDPKGTYNEVLDVLVASQINADDDLVARWHTGGSEARQMLKEQYTIARDKLGLKTTSTTDVSKAADKAAAIQRNKKLPAPGVAEKVSSQGERRKKPGVDRVELGNRAWDEFQKTLGKR